MLLFLYQAKLEDTEVGLEELAKENQSLQVLKYHVEFDPANSVLPCLTSAGAGANVRAHLGGGSDSDQLSRLPDKVHCETQERITISTCNNNFA